MHKPREVDNAQILNFGSKDLEDQDVIGELSFVLDFIIFHVI